MIDYEEDNLLRVIFKLEGSVALRSSLFAVPAALICLLFLRLDEWSPDLREDLGLTALGSSQVWSASTVVLISLLAFRARQGLARFWEGTGLLHQMRGEWFDTVSNCISFSLTAKPKKPDEVNQFRHAMVRLMSLCHGSALEEVASDGSLELPVIDVIGLNSATKYHLWECSEIHHFNRVEVCIHLLQSVIVQAHHDGVLLIPPPILSRVFQTISRGFVNLLNTKKITCTKFPYPFAQVIAMFLLLHLLVTPALISACISHKVMAPLFTFASLFGMFSVNFIAIELENPFGNDANDLPLEHFQEEMNLCLLMLLHPNTDLVANVGSECQYDFNQLTDIMRGDFSSQQTARRLWNSVNPSRATIAVKGVGAFDRADEIEEVNGGVGEREEVSTSTSTPGSKLPEAEAADLKGPSQAAEKQASKISKEALPQLVKSISDFSECLHLWTSMMQTMQDEANAVANNFDRVIHSATMATEGSATESVVIEGDVYRI
eukprot:TRINITY_DN29277_c0_g1_i1.p1 TRINITY_DN29277_c0_g1~~TRINITY_DN29277_c0_g1_i1.p1  ORF type:complete len:491 (+),score=71.48 TRINITY_DN29277_c0_g1_i1:62-1534(+)